MSKLLFSASYEVTYENRTGSNTYTCQLSFFDDHRCTRVLKHRMYDCEPPFGGESTTYTSYEGRWHSASPSSGEEGDRLHIEEDALERAHWLADGHGGASDQRSERERSPEKIMPIMVEVGPLLAGYIIGEHTGAQRRLALLEDASDRERRHTEGDAAAFLAVIRGHAQAKPPSNQLFSTRYTLEYKTHTSQHAYTCELTFFDDLTCAREFTYEDRGSNQRGHTTRQTFSGRWRVTAEDQEGAYELHIEEPTIPAFHSPKATSGEGAQQEPSAEGRALMVKSKALLNGYIQGKNTGAPERPWSLPSGVGMSEHRHHEGDKAAFVEFLQRHAERLA